jgi:microcystin-dependent protein
VTEPFLAEIRLVSFDFAPKGWALCNGQLLPINQNQALFALLGTAYGGNGQTTFALPDLRDRVPMHVGSYLANVGQAGGQATHTLTAGEMPAHTHAVVAGAAAGTAIIPTGNLLARTPASPYADPGNPDIMGPLTVSTAGGSQPHENRSPFLKVAFCIALQGIFPTFNS